ncbi:MAG: noncanonical pyrimidine nucleotidase, YjjG family [Niastella sp.]|nr:noncanonical pyrimidine nucleotidase, YjjG family [Niastella sp.]
MITGERRYKHLFFDLDHTLWDFDVNAKIAITEVYQIFNLDKFAAFDEFYQNYLVHNATLWNRYEKGFISVDELKWRRMWRTLLDFKIANETLAKEMSLQFLEILPHQKAVFPYTFEILDYLAEKNYTLHLITNGFEKTQWKKLQNSSLDKYFTAVITSEASNSLKPKKEIFEYALAKANANLPQSIMIGDNQDADIQGAINAGMDSVFVNHIQAENRLKPTYMITHLQELENIF